MRVGVTGGAGFIGGYVCDELLDRGHTPIIFDHRGRGLCQCNKALKYDHDIEVMLGDCRDETAVTEFAARVDGIIHLASVLGTQETVQNPRPAVTTNIIAGMNVMEAATQYNLPVVNICVGNAGMANPYSASKTCVESLGWMYVRDRGTRLNQVRVVNAYGPRQIPAAPYGPAKVRKIMPAFICRALTGNPIVVYGDGQQVSDCVYVHDVAVGLVNALELASKDQILGKVAEVGPEDHTTVLYVAQEVAARVQELTESEPVKITHAPMRPGETPGARVVADTSTLPLLGMKVEDLTPLREGVKLTVEWFAQNWLPDWEAQTPSWLVEADRRRRPWRPLP